MVNIPVRVYAATEEKDVHFKMLHRPAIPHALPAALFGLSVVRAAGEIVRGYEVQPGQYVIVEDEDLARLGPGTEQKY